MVVFWLFFVWCFDWYVGMRRLLGRKYGFVRVKGIIFGVEGSFVFDVGVFWI